MYSPGWGSLCLCVVALYVGEGSEREQYHLLGSWLAFNHFPHYPQANGALLVLIPGWVGLCTFQDLVGLSSEHSCEARSFSHGSNPHCSLPPEVLRLYFPPLEPWVMRSVSLPSCSFQFIRMQVWDYPVHQPPPRLPGPPVAAFLCFLSGPAFRLCPSYQSE